MLVHRIRYATAVTAAAAATAVLLPLGLTSATAATATTSATATHHAAKPTIVLVHGAWADGSSWSGEVSRLQHDGYTVAVAPNPLRGLSSDAAYLRDYLAGITGPIVLVGHSYGGAVITNAATGNTNVKALVYIDAYLPDTNQTVADLSGKDSALAPAVTNPTSVFKLVNYPGAPTGVYDTYVLPDVFVRGFAGDLPPATGAQLAASQPPTSLIALGEHSGTPAWKTIPSWVLIGTKDKIIPEAQQVAMAKHAGARTQKINASHLGIISQPGTVTSFIEKAARAKG
ncbi:alpha/beta hydrolase [Sphaerisporangium aureirubrum]|uniref:Alpha/beta hydrolase n=1 Tax=Sphaerisporangium aureirubrum TaxID=1544736 RepID=A0ABW1NHC8_9ACTN